MSQETQRKWLMLLTHFFGAGMEYLSQTVERAVRAVVDESLADSVDANDMEKTFTRICALLNGQELNVQQVSGSGSETDEETAPATVGIQGNAQEYMLDVVKCLCQVCVHQNLFV
jgi:hypothetical protein